MTQGQGRIFFSRFFAAALAVISVGCGGGPGSNGAAPTEKTASSTIIINADPGNIIAVRVDETAELDGSSSSASTGQPLTYAWSFSHKPDVSNTQLENATTANPSFVADARGTYMVQLVVSAGGASSQRAIAFIEVTDAGERLTGERLHVAVPGGDTTTSYSSNCTDSLCHNGWHEKVTAKSPDHIATSNMCEACHTTFGFEIPIYTDHLEVFGSCSVCHDGILAVGQSDSHVKTSIECDSCHNTDSFLNLRLDGGFDHIGITRDCNVCHNGIVATGKHDGHIDTNGDCYICHITDNFQDATFDHSNIVDGCVTCHDDGTAIGKDQALNHPVTSDNCEVCHNTDTFNLGGVFNHNIIDEETQPCESCHDGNHEAAGARGITDTAIHTNAINGGVDCGACHNTRDFLPAFVDHTSAAVIGVDVPVRCDSCHNNTDAVGKPSPNHMPTNEDCDVCHTPGNFATGQFDHNPTVVDPVTCDTCHDDVIMAGKPGNHLPTTDDCRVCHGTDTFSGATVDHSVIFDNCATCHNGNAATGKEDADPTHIPTSDDCSSCHVYGVAFTPSTFLAGVHTSIISDCQDCHGEFATDKPRRTHIPTLDDCSTCHVTNSFVGATFNHTGIDRGCEGCHNGRFTTAACTIKGKTVDCIINGEPVLVDHIPTNQDCYLCHTVDAFTPSTFAHLGISGNCDSCHDGTRDATGAIGKTSVRSRHPDTTADCGVCHSTADAPGTNAPSFSVYFIDHTDLINNCTTAGCHDSGTDEGIYAASNAHGPTNGNDCELCHTAGAAWVPAVFDHSNLPRNPQCDSCHGVNATGKDAKTNPAHITTTEDCDVCHNTTTFAGATFDHQGIVDNCASCHNGDTATGKPNNHVPTNGDCLECHQTTGFIPATFDHVGIVDNCQSCHDGVLATGKRDAVNHISTNQDCGVCHNTTGFIPAIFDHSGINSNCARSGCHGSGATGKSQNHLATNLDCSSCHTTATFVGGTWDHTGITGDCVSCHDGNIATGNSPQGLRDHFITTRDCNVCHTTRNWAANNYNHLRNGDYPGDHRANLGCKQCHKQNNQNINYPASDQRLDGFCAGCHENDFRREGDHIGGNNGTVYQNRNCGQSGCHRVSDRNWD
jgi:hypothetical protein